MRVDIFDVIKGKLVCTQSDVAFTVKPDCQRISIRHKNPLSNIHFFALVTHRVFDVLLYDVRKISGL